MGEDENVTLTKPFAKQRRQATTKNASGDISTHSLRTTHTATPPHS